MTTSPDGDGTTPVEARVGGTPALVGREAELAVLTRAWRRAVAGEPGLVLVRGEAGVGKTRLVAELATLVRERDGVVAESGCYGTSDRLALAPVADWLRVPAVHVAVEALDPVWRLEVERLVPRAGRADPGLVDGARAMADAWRRHRFSEGLAQAFLQVGRPLLLVLDNLQWGDQETLAFLAHLLGRAGDAPLLVVGTARDEPGAVDGWFPRMRATGVASELALDPLDAAGTARLATAVHGRPPDDPEALHAVTGGLPLHVVEAVQRTRRYGGRDAGGPRRDAARPPGGGEPHRPRRRRPRRRRRARVHPRPARRGQRPGRGGRGPGARRALAPPDRPRDGERLRLLARPPARGGRRAGQPAHPLAAAPPPGARPRGAARRRPRRRVGAAGTPPRPERAPGAGGVGVPARRPRRRLALRPRRGDPAAPGGAAPGPGPARGPAPRRGGARPPRGADRSAQRAPRVRVTGRAGDAGGVGGARPPDGAPGRRAVRAGGALDRPLRRGRRRRVRGDRDAGPGDGRRRPCPRRARPLRGGRIGVRPRAAPAGAAPLRGRRRRGEHGVAQRRHPPRRARRGVGRPRPLAARRRRPGPQDRRGDRRAGTPSSSTPTASPSRWPTTRSPTSSATTARPWRRRWPS